MVERECKPIRVIHSSRTPTPRQIEVVAGYAMGLSRSQIADRMGGISVKTVDKHRSDVIERLDTTNGERSNALLIITLIEMAVRSGEVTFPDTPGSRPLTSRQREIVAGIAEGKENEQIAKDLGISLKTVERHITNSLRKLGARTRYELVARIVAYEARGE